MGKVEIHLALMWICDECGRDNFQRGMLLESEAMFIPTGEDDEDDEDSLEDDAENVDDEDDGEDEEDVSGILIEPIMIPEQVTCQYCGVKFEVEDDDESTPGLD